MNNKGGSYIDQFISQYKLMIKRKLGSTVELKTQNPTLQTLFEEKNRIMEEVKTHGVVLLKNLHLSPSEMLKLATQFCGAFVKLPPFFLFNNPDKETPQIAWVGNVKPDGTLKINAQKEANYWHQDGNFWRAGQKVIFNFLHSKQKPDSGGQTWFLDLVEGYNILKEKDPQLIKLLSQYKGVVDLFSIPDFANVDKSHQDMLDTDSITIHDIITDLPFACQKTGLFLGHHSLQNFKGENQKFPEDPKNYLNPKNLIQRLVDSIGFYSHSWEVGDILVWDNSQVMHKSSGKYEGRRLLFRAQGAKTIPKV